MGVWGGQGVDTGRCVSVELLSADGVASDIFTDDETVDAYETVCFGR